MAHAWCDPWLAWRPLRPRSPACPRAVRLGARRRGARERRSATARERAGLFVEADLSSSHSRPAACSRSRRRSGQLGAQRERRRLGAALELLTCGLHGGLGSRRACPAALRPASPRPDWARTVAASLRTVTIFARRRRASCPRPATASVLGAAPRSSRSARRGAPGRAEDEAVSTTSSTRRCRAARTRSVDVDEGGGLPPERRTRGFIERGLPYPAGCVTHYPRI